MHHDRDAAIAELKAMPQQIFVDGLLLDCPKRRRREQAMNKRPMLIKLPPDQKKRLGTQINRYIELLGKDLGIEVMLRFIERQNDEDLKGLAEEGDGIGAQA